MTGIGARHVTQDGEVACLLECFLGPRGDVIHGGLPLGLHGVDANHLVSRLDSDRGSGFRTTGCFGRWDVGNGRAEFCCNAMHPGRTDATSNRFAARRRRAACTLGSGSKLPDQPSRHAQSRQPSLLDTPATLSRSTLLSGGTCLAIGVPFSFERLTRGHGYGPTGVPTEPGQAVCQGWGTRGAPTPTG